MVNCKMSGQKLLLVLVSMAILFFVINWFVGGKEGFEQGERGAVEKRVGSPIFKYNDMIRWNMKNKLDDPKWTRFVDKLLFKKYARSRGVPSFRTLAVYDQKNYKNITFSGLPKQYVIKSNKASARNIIVKDSRTLNKDELFSQVKKWGEPFWNKKNEPQYEYTQPKIFIEEYIDPLPEDIKIWFHNGNPTLIQIEQGRFTDEHTRIFYDIRGELLPIKKGLKVLTDKNNIFNDVVRDGKLKELLTTASKLARDVDLDLFRVDVFYLGGKFYAGEITLSPAAALTKIEMN